MMAKTLYQKIYQSHVVAAVNGSTDLLFVDRHLIHEVTSPQAFAGCVRPAALYAVRI